MKRLFACCIYVLLNHICFGQNRPLINDPFVGLPVRPSQVRNIDSLNQLPTRISYIIENLLKTAMTDFVDNIFFIQGQDIDLESLSANDSIFQIDYKYVVPKYELFFELRDTTIGIKSHCLRLSLDKYGQILQFDWPRDAFNKRDVFIEPVVLEKTALRYARAKKYKTETCLYGFYYDEAKKCLCWHFSYLQKSTGDEFNYAKKYKTIVVDALENYVIEELDMRSVGISD